MTFAVCIMHVYIQDSSTSNADTAASHARSYVTVASSIPRSLIRSHFWFCSHCRRAHESSGYPSFCCDSEAAVEESSRILLGATPGRCCRVGLLLRSLLRYTIDQFPISSFR